MMIIDYDLFPDPHRCKATVWVKDCYRVKRGHGFAMHYNRKQCSRQPVDGKYCKQHGKLA